MTEESSTVSHLSNTMTTETGETSQTTGGSDVTSSSSRGVTALYFEIAVVIIGVVGTAANGLVVYALVASKQHRKHVLIVNQNALDLYSCIFLIITYGMKLFDISMTGSLGYWLCMFIASENLLWVGVYGSFCNLTVIAAERYVKVVHPVWSKKHLRKWMIYSAIAFVWISSFVHQMAVAFESSAVIDGACYGFAIWKNPATGVAYGIFYFFAAFAIVLAICVFCYSQILIAIRRQARVMASHNAAGSSTAQSQTQSNQIQSNLIKTMILVCAFYAVAWMPLSVYFLLMNVNQDLNLSLLDSVYYSLIFIAFLYTSAPSVLSSPSKAIWRPKSEKMAYSIIEFAQTGFVVYTHAMNVISLYLRQPIHLRRQVSASQAHPGRSNSVQEGLAASWWKCRRHGRNGTQNDQQKLRQERRSQRKRIMF